MADKFNKNWNSAQKIAWAKRHPELEAGSSAPSAFGNIAEFFTGKENENSTYHAQKQASQRTRDYNAREAKKLRDWQEGLANSAIQRRMADYKKAGINPIMVAQWGGADTPGGASASTGMEQIAKNPVWGVINSVIGGISSAHTMGMMNKSKGAQMRNQNQQNLYQRQQMHYEKHMDRELKRELHRSTLENNAKTKFVGKNYYN